MSYTKIATCCYCGTRAAMVLRGETRHELACASCGAPLHNMKQLKVGTPGRKTRPPEPARPTATAKPGKPDKPYKSSKKKKKKKKSLTHRLFDEAFDLLDDIFD